MRESLLTSGATPERAEALEAAIDPEASPLARWQAASAVLAPEDPFEVHRAVHASCFAGWDASIEGPAPMSIPDPETLRESNLGRALADAGEDLETFHRRSVEDPEGFWSDMLVRLGIRFASPPRRILEGRATHPVWLPGAELNIAETALSGDDDRTAVVVGSEGSSEVRSVSLAELRADAMRVRSGLERAGIEPGDRVAIAMPMTYDSVAIYLGIVARGAAVVSIADSFSASEISTRLQIAEAKLVFTQDVILRGDKALPLFSRFAEADQAPAVILPASGDGLQIEPREGDRTWLSFLAEADSELCFETAPAQAVTNVLFSSGTTGSPKAIPWTHITPLKAATDAWGHHDVRPGDVVAWPTNLGWMMGPWLVYASLLNQATIALYEGLPHSSGFTAFVDEARVTMLGVVPSLVKAWRSNGAFDGKSLDALRAFSSTGEASNPDDMAWLMSRARYRPVIEYCGGTEIGGGYVTGTVVQPQVASAFSLPALGSSFYILDESGRPTDEGEVALKPPMLGSSTELLNRDHFKTYFEGMPPGPKDEPLRRHGDRMRRLPGAYFRAMGRIDDTMNLGGIKVSSAEIERALQGLSDLVETAAVAVHPPDGGPSELVVFAVVKAEPNVESLKKDVAKAISSGLNPLFKLRELVVVDTLPRTASGKVMRRVLRTQFEP